MLNKNVADYTNFDGKTNKKIVQAPGGASSFSLAWSSEKTDYGPERNIRKEKNTDPYQQYQQPQRPQERPNYSEPIRVMEDVPAKNYGNQGQGYGAPDNRIGGEYGYKGYSNNRQPLNEVPPRSYEQSTPTKPGHYGGYKNQPV